MKFQIPFSEFIYICFFFSLILNCIKTSEEKEREKPLGILFTYIVSKKYIKMLLTTMFIEKIITINFQQEINLVNNF